MNAVILAAGRGSRMVRDGYLTPKPLLPILGIPNIERTVLMLNEFGIENIIILCNREYFSHYSFLNHKYKCQIVPNDLYLNTLYSISCIIDEINNTFIIEGDVVLARNIFVSLDYSFYYTMKYHNCESDAWCPIIKNGKIIDFKIGRFTKPCIFGVSFWHTKDCMILKSALKSVLSEKNFQNANFFWDDCICSILDKLEIGTYEIAQTEACEMNTGKEYDFAQKMCYQYYRNCENFILNSYHNLDSHFQIEILQDPEVCNQWQNRLENYIDNNSSENMEKSILTNAFNEDDHPFMVKDTKRNSYIAYFDIAENIKYLLLRRIFIDEPFRRQGLGSEIVKFVKLYSKLSGKEMRVNVYDKKAEIFYRSLGMKLYFKTFRF